MRRALSAVIDRAIALMDALDAAGEDLEPSLGAAENHPFGWGYGLDASPSLDQAHWATGGTTDLEIEDEHATDLDHGEAEDVCLVRSGGGGHA